MSLLFPCWRLAPLHQPPPAADRFRSRIILPRSSPLRSAQEVELLKETDFLVGQMNALVSVGSLPEPARPSPAEDEQPAGAGRFLATLSKRRIALLVRSGAAFLLRSRSASCLQRRATREACFWLRTACAALRAFD